MNTELLKQQLEFSQASTPYALATVVEIFGSASAKPGAKALIDASGQVLIGWVGGGCAQAMVISAALSSLQSGQAAMIEVDLNDEFFGAGMPCGGHMRVFVEPVMPKPRVWLTGNGRIVEALARFADAAGFAVLVIDAHARANDLPGTCRLIVDDPHYQQLKPNDNDFVVIASHHKGDYHAISQALSCATGYIGLVASQQRAGLIKQRLKSEGFNDVQLARLRAPAGLALGGIEPTEIALSIISEMVMIRRGGSAMTLANNQPGEQHD
ncbi:MAG: XdhC family protein [Methylococcales bacterium]|nr:XdhC family protein [Methylococcales bacterium]